MDFRRRMDPVRVSVASRYHPALLLLCQLLPRPFFCGAKHTPGYWSKGSTSVYWLALGTVDVGICNKGCLSLSCMSPCPPAGVFTSAKKSCEAEVEERLCDSVVPAVCPCLSGKGSGSLVCHTWLPWLIGDYFWLPCCVFSYNYLFQSLHQFDCHSSNIKCF